MRKPIRSLLWATLVAAVCLTGVLALSHRADWWPWRLFAIPIWWPLTFVWFLDGGLQAPKQAYDVPLTFVLAVLMWWGFIEAGRRFLKRLRQRPGS